MRQRVPTPATAPAPADPTRAASVRRITEGLSGVRGPLLPVLHEVLAAHGFIHDDDVPVVADVLNLSRADVHGAVSFYPDFRRTAPPAHRLALCRAEACQARGAAPLYAAVSARWADTPDVEVDEVFCLGNCALGPSGTVDGRLHGRLSPERVAALTKRWSS